MVAVGRGPVGTEVEDGTGMSLQWERCRQLRAGPGPGPGPPGHMAVTSPCSPKLQTEDKRTKATQIGWPLSHVSWGSHEGPGVHFRVWKVGSGPWPAGLQPQSDPQPRGAQSRVPRTKAGHHAAAGTGRVSEVCPPPPPGRS